jgi:hypothetical protein
MIDPGAMPSNKKKAAEQDYAVGDRVRVNLHTGRIVDATIKSHHRFAPVAGGYKWILGRVRRR